MYLVHLKGKKGQITHHSLRFALQLYSFLCLCFSFSAILQFYSPYPIIQQCQCLHCTNSTHSCHYNIDAVIVLHVFTIYISYVTFGDKCGFLSFTFCFSWRD